jgi:hypothetical protein
MPAVALLLKVHINQSAGVPIHIRIVAHQEAQEGDGTGSTAYTLSQLCSSRSKYHSPAAG